MSTVIHTATTMRGATKHAWVECEITPGIGIHVVGSIEQDSVPEILLRVVTAIEAAGYTLPGKKIVINVSRETGTTIGQYGKGGDTWLDLEDLKEAVELLMALDAEEGCRV